MLQTDGEAGSILMKGKDEMNMCKSRYGHFSEDGSEYIITRPDTPRPWYNRIGNERYSVIMSQCAGGYAIAGDDYRWLLNWYVPKYDESGRYLFVRDNDDGSFWSASYAPVRARLDSYECRHGSGWSTFTACRAGIETKMTVFVPVDEAVELWDITVTNTSERKRNITVFPFLDWTMDDEAQKVDELVYAAESDGWREEETNSVIFGRRLPERFQHQHGFMSLDCPVNGWDSNRAAFVGAARTLACPAAVENGSCTNTPSYAEVSITAMHKRFSLKSGQSFRLSVMAGKCNEMEERQRLRSKFFAPDGVKNALSAVKTGWAGIQDRLEIKTPDPALDLFVNKWLNKHVYTLGATNSVRIQTVGFRNRLQDVMGMSLIDPAGARKLLVTAMKYQFKSGECPLNWSLGKAPHGRPRHIDAKIWLVLATVFYIRQTGDFDVLKEEAVFMDEAKETTLLDKLLLALDRTWKERGAHGLSLIGEGDWNDNLNGMGRAGRGESVWMSEAVLWALEEMKALLEKLPGKSQYNEIAKRAGVLRTALNSHAWDRDRFIMGYNDDGMVVGGRKSEQVKLFLMPQSWAILSGLVSGERADRVVRTVESGLFSPYGPLIMDRPYSEPDRSVGSITYLAKGMSENGPVYSHAAAFMLCAYAAAGAGDLLYRDFMALLPLSHDPAVTLCEPFVMPNFYRPDAVPRKAGATHRTWTTSTPHWLLRAVVEGMFGLKADFDALIVDPVIPARWKKCSIKRRMGGAILNVNISNPGKVQRGVKEIRLDGRLLSGNRVKIPASGIHLLEVLMG